MASRIFLTLFLCSTLLFGQSPPDLLKEVTDLQNSMEFEKALTKAEEAMSLSDGEDRVLLALIYCELAILMEREPFKEETIEVISDSSAGLSPYLDFALAKLYLMNGKIEKAAEKIESLNGYASGSYFRYEILREKANIYRAKRLYGKEALVWGEVLSLENLRETRKMEALFNEAKAWQKAGAEARAKRIYRNIAFDYSLNPFGSAALKEYVALGAEDYPPKETKAKEELFNNFLKCGRAEEALDLLKTFPKEKDVDWILAQALYKARRDDELFQIADRILAKNVPSNGDNNVVLKALWATLRTNDKERNEKYYDFFKKKLDETSKSLIEANYAKGNFLFVNGNFKEAVSFFEEVKKEGKSPFYQSSVFKSALCVFKIGQKPPEGFFNVAKLKNGFEERAVFLLRKFFGVGAGEINKKGYYASLLSAEFGKKTGEALKDFNKRLFAGKINRRSLAFRLYDAGFPLFALDQLEKETGPAKEDIITKAFFLSQIGELCYEIPKDLDYRIGLSHPTPWKREIMLAAKEEGVDPAIMFAIARRESRFDPLVYSAAGAVGLFQLMPGATLKYSGGEAREGEMLDPLKNARIAARYLKKLKEAFPIDAQIAASYNAGEDVSALWRASFGDEEPLFVLMIPYAETQSYTEGVLLDKAVYNERLKYKGYFD